MTNPKDIRIEEYDYPLPDEKIARHPLAVRDECKLLMSRNGVISEHIFKDLPLLLPTPTTLVYNNTRVINARLRFTKASGGKIEIFCLEPVSPADYATNFSSTERCTWKCFVGNSKRWKEGRLAMQLNINGKDVTLEAERLNKDDSGSIVELSWNDNSFTFADIISSAGEIPIPPYLNRATEETDSHDYQTVFSHIDGSVAAPTAGLHFTPTVLDAIDRRGIAQREVTLHVGAGTFQPVKSDTIGDHEMHSEFISVDRSLIEEFSSGDCHITAVGTTSVRTLESLYHIGCMIHQRRWEGVLPQWYPYEPTHPRLTVVESMKAILDHIGDAPCLVASTRLMIAPGYTYSLVETIITNFHQPRSTLLLLVSAFLGDGSEWRRVYDYALADPAYRFLSYGDACLFLKPLGR